MKVKNKNVLNSKLMMKTNLTLVVDPLKYLFFQSRGGGLHHWVHVYGGPAREGSTA